eukprot:TRINITY_DN76415_c0_g1_i1.p1 TRINITY_DN76415_c0_g1~~TRINITY_DN76415_c0_g1_i1.p1  ORF type:complete len:225 (-),score=54.19 TRINITY_DN76415_c0_g1_i1:153-827(-)
MAGFFPALKEVLDRKDLSAVGKAAWAAYQFTMIHPFPDGNGRIGRLLANAVLHREGGMPVFLALANPRVEYVRAMTDKNGTRELASQIQAACWGAAVAYAALDVEGFISSKSNKSLKQLAVAEATIHQAQDSINMLSRGFETCTETCALFSGSWYNRATGDKLLLQQQGCYGTFGGYMISVCGNMMNWCKYGNNGCDTCEARYGWPSGNAMLACNNEGLWNKLR